MAAKDFIELIFQCHLLANMTSPSKYNMKYNIAVYGKAVGKSNLLL